MNFELQHGGMSAHGRVKPRAELSRDTYPASVLGKGQESHTFEVPHYVSAFHGSSG